MIVFNALAVLDIDNLHCVCLIVLVCSSFHPSCLTSNANKPLTLKSAIMYYRLLLHDIAMMQDFYAFNEHIAHIFDIISLYCIVKIIYYIFIRVVFSVLYCLETTGNAIFKVYEVFS